MALFKINRGNESNLPGAMTEGYAYFCPDTGRFFIDVKNASGTLERKKISAEYADKLRYKDGDETVEIDVEILARALDKLGGIENGATKTNITMKTWTVADIGG